MFEQWRNEDNEDVGEVLGIQQDVFVLMFTMNSLD